VGILLIISGNVWQAVFVIVAFLMVIANIDNILRPNPIPKEAQLNPSMELLTYLMKTEQILTEGTVLTIN
jgi:predicted PurR-regulated permease PerM